MQHIPAQRCQACQHVLCQVSSPSTALQELIGGTILSWGETIPELVASYALARMGHSTMAIASCFAGPVFNLMVGLSLPVMYQTLMAGSLAVDPTNGIVLLVLQTVVVLIFLATAVPLYWRWQMHQWLSYVLVSVYVVFQLFFFLTQSGFVLKYQWSASARGSQSILG